MSLAFCSAGSAAPGAASAPSAAWPAGGGGGGRGLVSAGDGVQHVNGWNRSKDEKEREINQLS